MHRLRTVTYLDVGAVAGHHAMPAALLLNKLGPLDASQFMALRIHVDTSELLLFKYKIQEESLRQSKP